MDNQLFREKSVKQFSTPEQLTDYLRVTGPGVWFVLVGIIVILLGGLFWSIFGNIVSSVQVPAQIQEGKLYCYILQEDFKRNDPEIDVIIGDVKMTASIDDAQTIILDSAEYSKLYASGYLSPGKSVVMLTCPTDLKDGIYDATVVTEAIHPISLIFSKN